MRKTYFAVMTFLYMIVLSKTGSGQTWTEFIEGITSRTPSDITSLFMALLVSVIVYIKTSNIQKKISILNIVAIIGLVGIFYMSLGHDKKAEENKIYQISSDLPITYKVENRLLINTKTNEYLTGTIQVFQKGTNKVKYEITFNNGRAVNGFKYKSNGEKEQLSHAHLYNMGLNFE